MLTCTLNCTCNRTSDLSGTCHDRRHEENDHRVGGWVAQQMAESLFVARADSRAEHVDRIGKTGFRRQERP